MSRFETIGRRVSRGMHQNGLNYEDLMKSIKEAKRITLLDTFIIEINVLFNLNLITDFDYKELLNAIMSKKNEL